MNPISIAASYLFRRCNVWALLTIATFFVSFLFNFTADQMTTPRGENVAVWNTPVYEHLKLALGPMNHALEIIDNRKRFKNSLAGEGL